MKTLEDFEVMEVGQLKAILKSLDVAVPDLDFRKAENKAKLVQLAYDVQQPEAGEDPAPPIDEAEPEAPRTDNTKEMIANQMDEIIAFFGGTDMIEAGEDETGATLFVVVDEMTDEEKARGTFAELRARVQSPATAELGEVPLAVEPEAPPVPVENEKTADAALKGLEALAKVGLKFTVDGSVVRLSFGSKSVTTTLNQPAHRVIRTAEQLCNVVR